MSSKTHPTTRRGFIATLGFGGVSLYGLWAAYGAAPGPLTLLGLDGHHDGEHAHGGHGAPVDGPSVEEFNRLTSDFIERYRLEDSTVHPRILATGQADHGQGEAHDHGDGHAPAAHDDDPAHEDVRHRDDHEPLDVYLAAGKWYYRPHALRLDAGRAYRFRMMAVDVSHGASIQFGRGGRMVRLRPGRLAEMEITFHRPGRHLVYCTVYCGPAHDFMQALIEVV